MAAKATSSNDPLGRLFHRPGLCYFFVLNHTDDRETLGRLIDAFAKDHAANGVILHPRSGLRVPYGGDDWFDMIDWIVGECAKRNLPVWLYDEDPYPSGAAGGRIMAEHPEWVAHEIIEHVCEPDAIDEDGLFHFPAGRLLWCGTIDPHTGQTTDLTSRVGMIREKWTVLAPWDSTHYYANTPVYECPRAFAGDEHYALRVPKLESQQKLVAYITAPKVVEIGHWRLRPDALNPEATRQFIAWTHEKYRRRLGEHFGNAIPAMFIDEPKFHASRPWTPGMFESFAELFGYDLRPRLWRLFDEQDDPDTLRTRLHFRQWCRRRFQAAWMQPVADWCKQNKLALVGHLSPEDDPASQSNSLGNLLPLWQSMHMPGIDLIVPAVGDHRHPMLNVGIVAARSWADQHERPGVMSESLACSGVKPDAAIARRVFAWQTMMGMTTAVVHGAFQSMLGHRAIDAPPDWGPFSEAWHDMRELAVDLEPIQRIVADAVQIAPVALLWPIRSFNAEPYGVPGQAKRRREYFLRLLQLCLDHQVGVHLLDEQDLWQAKIQNGKCHVGPCVYTHLLLPAATVWHKKTFAALDAMKTVGGTVTGFDEPPRYTQTDTDLSSCRVSWHTREASAEAINDLPRLIDLPRGVTDLRLTAWRRGEEMIVLAMNLRRETMQLPWAGRHLDLAPADVWQLGPGDEAAILFSGRQPGEV